MTDKFPVINSTLSAEELGKVIRQKYNLSQFTTCQLLRAAMNHLYVLTNETDRFVFRVYTCNWRTTAEVLEEVRLLLHLKENGSSVAFPLADNHQGYIQEFHAPEGTRLGVLFSYARGTKSARFSPEASFSIGKALAQVHKHTEGFKLNRVNYGTQSLLSDAIVRTKLFFQAPSDEINFLEKLAGFIHAKFDQADKQQLRSGAVHLDVWFDNMHLDEEDRVTFFDFDFCGNGWLCLDISYFLFQLFSTHPNNEEDYKIKAAKFLHGYEIEIEITDEEKELLPYACLAVMVYYIGIQCDRYDYWTNIFLNEDHLKRYIGNLRRWIAFNDLNVK